MLANASSELFESSKETGKQQFEAFLTERLKTGSASLYVNIKKNNLSLCRHKNYIVTSKSKQKIISLSSDRRLYTKLFVACQAREEDLEKFSAHENHFFPFSLSEKMHIKVRFLEVSRKVGQLLPGTTRGKG